MQVIIGDTATIHTMLFGKGPSAMEKALIALRGSRKRRRNAQVLARVLPYKHAARDMARLNAWVRADIQTIRALRAENA